MIESIRKVARELWELMSKGDREAIRGISQIKKQSMRLGALEDCLRAAVKESSVGYFNGKLCYFDGHLYTTMTNEAFDNMIVDLLFDYVKLPKVDYAAIHHIQRRCFILAKSKQLEMDNSLMVFRNGVLDTETGEFHKKFDKKFVQMWSVDYDFEPGRRTFLWHQFINQVLPDSYSQDVLQMFLGATFIDRSKVKIEHILILLGSGANGKSVINSVVLGVLGEYVGTKSIGSLCARGIDGEESLALINGKRLNYCSEMSVTDFKKKSARLKSIVSGERTSARFRYEKGFDAVNIPLLMANANAIPYFNTDDDALLRRIYPIPFEVVIPETKRNPMLADELKAEYPGILNWILEGRDKFIANGYKLYPEIHLKKLVVEGRTENDTVLKFMAKKGWRARIEGVDLAPRNSIKVKMLYEMYEKWCINNGLSPETKPGLTKILEDSGYQRRRFSDGYRFLIYGDITIGSLQNEKRRRREKEHKFVLTVIDGHEYATSRKMLSYFTGVSENILRKRDYEGYFNDCKKAFREKVYYDLQMCTEILRGLRDIATDEEKEIQKRINKELKYIRNIFNQRMAYNGLPYRKYATGESQLDGTIVVPDEMSDDEVLDMAEEAGYDVTRMRKAAKWANGAFGRGGKGFFESTDDIPTEEEKEMLE